MKETKICPFCGGEILATAIKCKHCKQFLSEEVKTSSSNNSFQENLLNKLNNKKIIIPAILVFIVICFIANSSDIVLSGCYFEQNNYNGSIRIEHYICKNKPYNSLDIFIDSSGNNPHTGHNVYKKIPNGEYSQDVLIARRIRNEGEYICDSQIKSGTIRPCSISQLKKLAIDVGENFEKYAEIQSASYKIYKTLSDIKDMRYEYRRHLNMFPSTLDELTEAFNNTYAYYRDTYKTNGYQVKAQNGNILSFSDDLQYLTVYDSETPKFYVTIKMNFENTEYEYVDKIIPADKYIKSASNLRQLTEEEMK